ncbi:MAG: TRAP transporter small permease [Oscillospiraceae bacterium]|nr:TRAP transporter small permease [Oscillospiraceae bacterium]
MLNRFFDKLSLICVRAASVILCIVAATVIVNIIGRLFNRPVKGTYEIVQYGILTTMCLAICRTGFVKKHVRVEMISDLLPAKPRAVAECLQMLVSVAAFGVVLILLCTKLIPEMLASGRLTDIFRFPYYIVYIILAVGMFLAALTFLYQAILSVSLLFAKGRGNDPKNKIDADVLG